MTRRIFLRVLGGAIAGAAISEAIPVPIPQDRSRFLNGFVEAVHVDGPLTDGMMARAYREAMIGSERPTMGICSASWARQMGLVFDVDVDDDEEGHPIHDHQISLTSDPM